MSKLKALVAVLNQRSDDFDSGFVTFEGVRYKMSDLPVWGEHIIEDTHNVWSWNETHYIAQDTHNDGDFIVVPRG